MFERDVMARDLLGRESEPGRVRARRWFLQQCGVGLGSMALADLLAGSVARGAHNPLQPRESHHAPRAKRVIFLFMAGAPSHLDLFDPKPKLAELDGQLPPPSLVEGYRAAFINPSSKFLGPRFKFHKVGRNGVDMSEVLPYLANVADELAVVKSMATDAFNHAPGQIQMSTGSQQFGRPSLGAWTLYGLGSESADLPGFVVFSTGNKGPSGGNSNWGSGFLPSVYQGVPFRTGGDPVLYLTNPPGVDDRIQRRSLDTLNRINQQQLDVIGDAEIATRINSYEMAYRMQASAPEVMDLSRETQQTLNLYGAVPGQASFANACLLARRLAERGVRFVEIFHESWDQHSHLVGGLKENCKATDQASAALIQDLKQRGMLQDTLVIWGGEFGRTPMVQGGADGRDHHPNAFTMWLAGGGIRPGVLGKTDEFGFNAVEDCVHVNDLHATILHLLGFDHLQLTYRFQGRDFRLTDVAGKVVHQLLA